MSEHLHLVSGHEGVGGGGRNKCDVPVSAKTPFGLLLKTYMYLFFFFMCFYLLYRNTRSVPLTLGLRCFS